MGEIERNHRRENYIMKNRSTRTWLIATVLFSSLIIWVTASTTRESLAQQPAGARGGAQAARADVANPLSDQELQRILDQAEKAASELKSLLRVNADGSPATTRMHIFVVDHSGKIMGSRSMADAWAGSVSIAISKAFTAWAFSSDQNALSTRTIGVLSQPGQPLWQIGNSNQPPGSPGLIEFPGGLPLYKDGKLVGAIGVSGDGVDQDEQIAQAGARGFEPPEAIRVDTVTDNAVPYVK